MDKREQIMQAALKLLVDHGTQATPMSAIARAAHTGMGTIYHYFATKEILIDDIFLYVKQAQVQATIVPPAETSLKRRFDYYYRGLLTYFITHPDYFRFINQYSNSPILTPETRVESLRVFAPISDLLLDGQHQGLVKDIPVQELMEFLYGGILGFARWAILDDKGTDQQLLANQLRIAWDAVKH